MTHVIDVQVALSVLTLLGVFGLWWHMARHAARVDSIDRRVVTLEERIANMTRVREQLDQLSSAVAAVDERTRSATTALHSIQEYLRNRE